MAFLEMHFQSEALKQGVSVNILLPDKAEGGKFKTLWLLHGQTDDHTGWMRYTSVERYADKNSGSKAKGWVYSVHVGSWGGMFTRVLWFLAAMLGATLPLTGYYLWIKRKFFKRK